MLYGALDSALEVTIVGSFSKLGIVARRAAGRWPDPPRLDGRHVVVTGGSSGIGRAATRGLAALGAHVWCVGRDHSRLQESVAAAADGVTGSATAIVADLVDPAAPEQIRDRIAETAGRVEGVVHNAGALLHEFRRTAGGTEVTVATHVLAPFRLTEALRPMMANPSVIVTVASGGMYTEPFDLPRLEMTPEDFKGAVAYARAKRAQVVLAGEWGRRLGPAGVSSVSMHPGWVRTPGLDAGLPRFAKMGPMLRTPEQGADTIVWLVSEALANGRKLEGFWLDRRRRGEFYKPGTRRDADQVRDDGARLWEWCEAKASAIRG